MSTEIQIVELIKEQNRLLQQQNDLLRDNQVQLASTRSHHPDTASESRMMTEYDLQLIVMAEDVLKAVDRWNKRKM